VFASPRRYLAVGYHAAPIVAAVGIEVICMRGEHTGVDASLRKADVLLESDVILHREVLGDA
jgi:hypothetical protein